MNVALLLSRAAHLHAERPALAVGTRVVASYAEFAERVARRERDVFRVQIVVPLA